MSDQRRKKNPELNTSRSGIGSAIIWSAVALACLTSPVKADEGGVSFWLPGLFGSLAAAPQQPGWSLSTIYYHTTRIGRRRRCPGARDHDRQNSGESVCQSQRESRCQGGPRHHQPDLCVRNAVPGRTGGGRPDGHLWPHQHLAGGDTFGRVDDALRHRPVPALRQHQRLGDGVRRLVSAVLPALERGGPQLHDLHHRRHTGRRLRLGAPVEHRHRARRDRRRRRLHLFQSADRA